MSGSARHHERRAGRAVSWLKRTIQQHVQEPLALALLEGKFGRGDAIVADVETGRIVFAKEVVGEVVS